MLALNDPARRALYDDIEFDARTLLPTYREWTRLLADSEGAEAQLQSFGPRLPLERKAQRRGREVDHRLLAKWDYYERLQALEMPGLDTISIQLRRHDLSTETLYATIVFDKHDSSGVFVRYTIAMAQRDSAWGKPLVSLDDRENADHSDVLRGLVYRYASTNAEMTFLKLSEHPDVYVEWVHRGTIGPAYGELNDELALPGMHEIAKSGGWIASFGLEMADRTIERSTNNDPLAGGQVLGPLLQARRTLGYNVHRDRKFVVSRGYQDELAKFVTIRGCQNVVYGI
ncbi:MAG: hypothetical protein ACJAYU_000189 [Bradymonadia bacterium]|jgi:hypothetical protein